MKLLLVSDTHGSTRELEAVLKRYANEVDTVLHLGDFEDDLTRYQRDYPQLKMMTVLGNCDFDPFKLTEQILQINGVSILMTHGHIRSVKTDLTRLMRYAREKQVNACFFGHTHQAFMEWNDEIFFMNPGSLGDPRYGNGATFGLVEISETGEITGEVVDYE